MQSGKGITMVSQLNGKLLLGMPLDVSMELFTSSFVLCGSDVLTIPGIRAEGTEMTEKKRRQTALGR